MTARLLWLSDSRGKRAGKVSRFHPLPKAQPKFQAQGITDGRNPTASVGKQWARPLHSLPEDGQMTRVAPESRKQARGACSADAGCPQQAVGFDSFSWLSTVQNFLKLKRHDK